ncbi:MAG TPA: DUF4203 domain-containing protein [Ktedonobacterales bacterium]|nr:DUF4203 domain-containing protein [Ktedonobacterales bacterium]
MNWGAWLIALALIVVGLAFVFAGYRLFRLLIPFWGFIVGFDVASIVGRAVFHTQLLASFPGWIIAIVVGLIFAALAYVYYYVSVVALAASVGFLLGEALATAFAPTATTVALVVGVIIGLALAALAIRLNAPKALIVVLTALGGASAAITGVLLAVGKVSMAALQASASGGSLEVIRTTWWLSLLTLALALAGIAAQANRLRARPYTHTYAPTRAPDGRPLWPGPRTV